MKERYLEEQRERKKERKSYAIWSVAKAGLLQSDNNIKKQMGKKESHAKAIKKAGTMHLGRVYLLNVWI